MKYVTFDAIPPSAIDPKDMEKAMQLAECVARSYSIDLPDPTLCLAEEDDLVCLYIAYRVDTSANLVADMNWDLASYCVDSGIPWEINTHFIGTDHAKAIQPY
jgi:hypothetical protein